MLVAGWEPLPERAFTSPDFAEYLLTTLIHNLAESAIDAMAHDFGEAVAWLAVAARDALGGADVARAASEASSRFNWGAGDTERVEP